MSQSKVSFARPPVIERVLSVQFEPLGMTAGHLGWFWKSYLDAGWTKSSNAPPLPDQFESFIKTGSIRLPEFRFETRDSIPVDRLRISNENGDRMLQIQDTRLIFNWIRKNDDYPRYPDLKAEFENHFAAFLRFTDASLLGPIRPNQWEVTYVNHIPAGSLWTTPADWPEVIPKLLRPIGDIAGTRFERMAGEWHSEIPDKRGRLHLQIQFHQREAENILIFNLTARGPSGKDETVWEKLDLGHDSIVQAFDEVTSQSAHEAWGKEPHGD
jgi:uncharacterized protein (TIGR04255 family)